MKQKIIILDKERRTLALRVIENLPFEPAHEVEIREYKSKRNNDQNAKMWAVLTDISEQVNWHGQKLTKEEWKDIITAALKRQKVVPGLDGGFVVLGASTSKMSIAEISEVIECAVAFGCQHQVKWRYPAED